MHDRGMEFYGSSKFVQVEPIVDTCSNCISQPICKIAEKTENPNEREWLAIVCKFYKREGENRD